jgi:hypothetical protein
VAIGLGGCGALLFLPVFHESYPSHLASGPESCFFMLLSSFLPVADGRHFFPWLHLGQSGGGHPPSLACLVRAGTEFWGGPIQVSTGPKAVLSQG